MFVVPPDPSREASGAAVQIKAHDAVSMSAEAMCKFAAADGDGRARDGLVGLGRAPALQNGREIQRGNPDGLGFRRAGLDAGSCAEQGGGKKNPAKSHIGCYRGCCESRSVRSE